MSNLVSVIIATYNSAPFVIETLESVKNQSWKELELIITDDFSTDNTIDLCEYWLKENHKRFESSTVLRIERNTGIAANANRGLKVAHGDWIKFLGADDTLKPNCIAQNMDFIAQNPQIKILFSKLEVYKDNFEPGNLLETTPGMPYEKNSILFPGRSADSQYRMLLISDRIHFSPSVFLHRETIFSVGCFDERFRIVEDYPLWLNLTKKGNKLYFMDKVTVNYRKHIKAANNTGLKFIINPNYFKLESFRKVYTYPFLPSSVKYHQKLNWYLSQIFKYPAINRDTKLNRLLYSLLTIYLNPFRYYFWFKKRFSRDEAFTELFT
ncbi:MAG TPA: glycosyltransferase [Bacteroidales bacterium]|nr:glycosyltransferase [Bacteroidales bacterium]